MSKFGCSAPKTCGGFGCKKSACTSSFGTAPCPSDPSEFRCSNPGDPIHREIDNELELLFQGKSTKDYYCGKYRGTYVLFYFWQNGRGLMDKSLYNGTDGPRYRFDLSLSYKLHLSGNEKTFSKGTKVLALKPNGEKYFTRFKPAQVVSKLTEKNGKKQYKVKFDGESEEFYVNQEFVIPTEEFWQKEDDAYQKESSSSESESSSSESSDEKHKKKHDHKHHKHSKHQKHSRKHKQPTIIIMPIYIPYGYSPNYQGYLY